MNAEPWLAQAQTWMANPLAALGPEGVWYAWLTGGIVLLVAWAAVAYRLIRRALGHRKFRGTWYSSGEYATLIKMLDEDNAKGHRVMQHDEMEALREWKFGSKKFGLGNDRMGSGYF